MTLLFLLFFSLSAFSEIGTPTQSSPPTKTELGRSFSVFDDKIFQLGDEKKTEPGKNKSAYGYERSVENSDDIMAGDQAKLMETCSIEGDENLNKRKNCYNREKKKLKAERKAKVEEVEKTQSLRGGRNPVNDLRKPSQEE